MAFGDIIIGTVLGGPSTPVDSNATGNGVLEGAPVNTTVGITASATSPGGGTVTYSLSADSSAGGFKIDPVTGVISVANSAKIDFESAPGHAYTVTVLANNGRGVSSQTFSIGVNNVNEAPSGTNANIVVSEDTPRVLTIADFGYSDVEGNALLSVRINNFGGVGTLTNNGVPVVPGTDISAADIAAGRLAYTPVANTSGNAQAFLVFTVRDNGGTANGGVDTDPVANALNFNVVPVNDAPTATGLTQSLTVAEDAAAIKLFTVAPAVADIDSGTVTAKLTVNAAAGTLIGAGAGVLNAGVLTYTITGTAAAVNAALAAVIYDSAQNFTGPTSVGVTVTDGLNGPQGVNPTGTVNITVNPINDAPTATNLTQSLTIGEDAAPTKLFTAAPVVADVDSGTVTATLMVNAAAGALVGAGAGVLNAGALVYTISGTPAAVSAALAAVTFDSAPDFSGATMVSVGITDGANGPQGTNPTGFVMVTVNAVNDAPTIAGPASQNTGEDTTVELSIFNFNGVSIADVDGAASQTVTVSVQHGILTLNGVAGLAFSVGDGVGDPTMTFSGSLANVNAALSRLFYRGDANYNGPDAITITTNDNGNAGSGGPQSATKTITLDVQAINDAPTATNLTQALIIGEDAAATTLFTAAPVVGDIDSANVTATLTLSAAAGVLVGAGAGVLNAGVLTYTITGTAAAVNAALAAVTYDSAADFSGATNVGVTISDGANGPQGVNPTGTVSITVNPVNDAPTATNLTQSLTINEDAAATPLFTAAPVVGDIDSANVTATLTVDAAAGVLNGAGAGVLNAGVLTYTITGAAAAVNAALAAVTFDSAQNFFGNTSVGVTVTDGLSGPQGINPTGTVSITVDPVNDAPTLAATANNPAYAPGVDLFSGVSASTIEPGQLFDRLVLTVTNVTGTVAESLTIDGTTVTLTNFNSVSTSTPGVMAFVAVAGSTATVTITSTGLSSVPLAALIDGLSYTNANVSPGDPPRVVTITELRDSGGTANGGADTATPGIASTVNFNIPPSVDVDGVVNYVENDAATSVDTTITITDPDNANMVGATVVISGGFVAGEDVLTFTLTGAITGSFVGNTLTLTGTGTQAEYEQVLESVQYQNTSNDPSAADRILSYSVNDGFVDSAADTATIHVAPRNDEPTLTATSSNPTFTENGAWVDLFSTPVASTIEAGQSFNQLVVTVTNVTAGFDALGISDTGVALSDGHSTSTGDGWTVSVAIAGSTATVTISRPTGVSATAMATLVDSLTYNSASEDPGNANRVVTITSLRDDGLNGGGDDNINSTLTVQSTVTVIPVNDEPTLTTTGLNPSFTENGAAVDLFSTPVVASAIESAQSLNTLVVTVSNVAGSGATESLFIDGTVVELNNGNSETTATNGMTASVVLAGTTATVTITKALGVSAATIQSIVDGLAYDNTSDDPGAATRVVTITSLSDTGPGVNPDDNTAAFNIASSVTVTPVNDAPAITSGATGTFTENGAAANVAGSLTLTDADTASLTGAVVTLTNAQSGDVLGVQGQGAATSGDLASGVHFEVDNGAHTVTFSNVDSVADYQAALQLVQFSNASEAPSAVGRTFTITANDGQAANNIGSANQTLTVVAVNDTPVNTGVPATQQTAFSDTAFEISGLSVSDVDSGAGFITTTLSASHGNITVTIPAGPTVGGNGTHSVTITGTLAQVQATLANDVTYQSDAGYTGQETFTILTNDNGNTGVDPLLTGGPTNEVDSDSVSIAVVPQVWFIDNTPGTVDGSAPLGSQNNPFTSIADFNASAAPGVNDYVYLREGTYTEADGINLKDGQTLVGQGENLQFANPFGGAPIIIETGSQGQTPLIIVTGNNNEGITLATNNSISGLDIGMNNATATGIEDGNATVGNLTISNVGVGISQNLGAAVDIDQGGQLNVILESVTSSGAARAIDLGTTAGLTGTGNNFTVSGATVINDATGDGITIANSSLNATFTGKVTILNDAGGANGDGVDLGTAAGGANTGTYNFNGGVDITVNGTGAFGLRATSSGTVGITDVGNTQIISNNGTAILINPTTFNATLDQVTSGGGSEGISLSGMSGSLAIASVSINGQTGDGIDITNSAGSVTINAGAIGNTDDPGGIGVDINGGSGNVTISASVAKISDGRAIEVTDHTGTAGGGSTITFNGGISSAGASDGIFLDNNDGTNGATINFTNTLTLNTSASNSNAFTATNGGTVTATGTGSLINSGSGTALNITGTTIGAADVTFQSISANGAVNGIVLNTTGNSGGLTVTGNGVNGESTTGGLITNTTGVGISLTNTRDVSLTNLGISNTGAEGIKTSSVTNFTYQDAAIVNAGDGNDENTIDLLNMFGTTLIEDVRLDDIQEDGIEIRQNLDSDANLSTFDTITIRRLNVQDHQAGFGEAGIEIQTDLASTLAVVVDDSDFAINTNAIMGVAMSKSATFTGHQKVTIQNSTFDGSASFGSGAIQALGSIGSGTTTYLVTGNTITNTQFDGIRINNDGGHTNATITNNSIDGSTAVGKVNNGEGITLRQDENGSMTVLISGNNISQITSNQIHINGGDATIDDNVLNVDATITNNTGTVAGAFGAGLLVDVGDGSGIAKNDVRINVSGNNLDGTETTPFFDFDITLNLNETSGASLQVTQASDAALSTANNGNSVSSFANAPATITYNAGTPPLPPLPLLAASGGVQASTPTSGETHLTQAQLDSAVAAGIAQWAHAGATPAQLAKLSAIAFTVADLAGNTIGDHSAGHVVIDTDAAGHGWFVDTTPSDNFEFAHADNAAGTDLSADPSSAAAGHLDLLTAVMHEMGHELGLDHAADAHDLMRDSLVDGERRLPTTTDVAQADGTEVFSFTNVCTGTAGADNFVFTDFGAAAANPVPRVADYSFAQGDTFDFSALTSQFHDWAKDDAFVVRAVADPSGQFATLQVNTSLDIKNPGWVSVAQIDGAHAGDHVSVLIDSQNAVHHVDLLI